MDRPNKQTLKAFASTRKVNADNDFIAGLTRMGIAYKVNG